MEGCAAFADDEDDAGVASVDGFRMNEEVNLDVDAGGDDDVGVDGGGTGAERREADDPPLESCGAAAVTFAVLVGITGVS
jgi:hypothetical protein